MIAAMQTVESLVTSPEVLGIIEAAAARAGIERGVGYLSREDVLSELTETTVSAARVYQPGIAKFTTFIWRRLVGKAYDLRRRHGRRYRTSKARPIETDLREAEDIPYEEPPADLRLDIERMISRLPLRERVAFLMKEVGGEDLDGVAVVLRANKTAAASCRMAAVRRLRIGLR